MSLQFKTALNGYHSTIRHVQTCQRLLYVLNEKCDYLFQSSISSCISMRLLVPLSFGSEGTIGVEAEIIEVEPEVRNR